MVQLRDKALGGDRHVVLEHHRRARRSNTDFQALLNQISQVVGSANFDGSNILNGSVTGGLRVPGQRRRQPAVHHPVGGKDLSLGGAIVTLGSTSTIGTITAAASNLAAVDASIDNVNRALGDLGEQAKQVDAHITFVGKLSDVLTTGVGNLVDADMAKESATLQALQVQQQLGAQSLSIANQAPQVILSLFR